MKKIPFQFLHPKTKTLTPIFIQTVLDASITSHYLSLKQYLDKEKIDYSLAEFKACIRLIEKQIFIQIETVSYLLYHLMRLSNNWGSPGEQQVKIAFCRNILEIPGDQTLTDAHVSEFYQKVDNKLEELGFNTLSEKEAQFQFSEHKLTLLGKIFKADSGETISKILKFIGSKLMVFDKAYNKGKAYIVAEYDFQHRAEFDVYYLKKEILRTPNYVMANAGISKGRVIILRYESLEAIFYQKWAALFEHNTEVAYRVSSDPFWNISQAIKEKALSLTQIQTIEQLQQKKEAFISDMGETILYHECGHGILSHYKLKVEDVDIGTAVDRACGFPIYDAIGEFLTDFAHETDTDIWGPMWNMVKISKTDRVRAERLFYIYLSDVWFYDTEDTYMYAYSDLITMILMTYIQSDHHIDFDKLEKDMNLHPAKDVHGKIHHSLIEKIVEMYKKEVHEIKAMMKLAKFQVNKELDYLEMRKMCMIILKRSKSNLRETDPDFTYPFWMNMFGWLKVYSKETYKKFEDYFKSKEKAILAKVMVLSAGRKKSEAYHFDHRRYITHRMTELGLTVKS